MSNFTRTHKIVILIIAMVLLLGFGYKTVVDDTSEIEINDDDLFVEKDIDFEKSSSEEQPLHAEEKIPRQVVVHITGEVAKPGIVTLETGGRVVDAIKKAGGLTPYADEKNINLAQKLFDEDKIVIPNIDEVLMQDDSTTSNAGESIEAVNTSPVVSSKTSGGAEELSTGQVNINTASEEQLKTLSGVGDATAQKIIDYRQSTPFATIDDIKNVSGIGEKKFEAIKNMITTR